MTEDPGIQREQGSASASRPRILLRIFLTLTLAAAVVAGGVFAWGYKTFHAPGQNSEDVTVIIEPGSSLTRIARALEDAGVIANAQVFVWGTRIDGRHARLTAGEYSFPPGVTALDIIDKLVSHDVVTRLVTVPEGLTSPEIVALLMAEPTLEGEIESDIPEGSLLPETYSYTRGTNRQTIIDRMRDAMDALRATAWELRQENLPIASWEDAVILASIIEKETAVAAERGKVAGVFVNRLRRGMRLQSDPTVAFAITEGKAPLGRPLTRADLRQRDPYNTYTSDGLPPGPICHPGRDAILAALNPEATSALYFVADGTGGHAFADTLAEHNRNVANWRRIQRQNRSEN